MKHNIWEDSLDAESAYDAGYDDGYDDGQDDGYAAGFQAGLECAEHPVKGAKAND
jgi:hypothetical protein